jgi:hypothetical protein
MDANRYRYGPLVSAVGAMLLGLSVFLPWYGLSFTAAGIAFTQDVSSQVASQFGNAALQSYMAPLHADLGALAGHQFAALSAHQVLKRINVLLLIIAGVGVLLSLLPLARAQAMPAGGDGTLIVVLGLLASVLVLYRMVAPPAPAQNLISFSLREGAWLALLGALAMIAGVFLPGRVGSASASLAASPAELQGAWSELSGWTPEA